MKQAKNSPKTTKKSPKMNHDDLIMALNNLKLPDSGHKQP